LANVGEIYKGSQYLGRLETTKFPRMRFFMQLSVATFQKGITAK